MIADPALRVLISTDPLQYEVHHRSSLRGNQAMVLLREPVVLLPSSQIVGLFLFRWGANLRERSEDYFIPSKEHWERDLRENRGGHRRAKEGKDSQERPKR